MATVGLRQVAHIWRAARQDSNAACAVGGQRCRFVVRLQVVLLHGRIVVKLAGVAAGRAQLLSHTKGAEKKINPTVQLQSRKLTLVCTNSQNTCSPANAIF
jgi:hypothetical protein